MIHRSEVGLIVIAVLEAKQHKKGTEVRNVGRTWHD